MSKRIGLVTRAELSKPARNQKRRKAPDDLPVEALRKLGLKGVRRMNPAAKHPMMPAAGSSSPLVYILGAAPGAEDDKRNKHLLGLQGRLLRRYLPDRHLKQIRWNNCVRTRPPKDRQPSVAEIECFRPSVEEDIIKTRPKLILGLGQIPLDWAVPSAGGISTCRGRIFPVKIGNHECWFMPTYHPGYLIRLQDDKKTRRTAEENKKIFKKDLLRAFQIAADKKAKAPSVWIPTRESVTHGTQIFDGKKGSIKDLSRALQTFGEMDVVAVDLETNMLRPYGKDPKILSISIGTSGRAVSLAIDHPDAGWRLAEKVKIRELLRRFFRQKARKIFHNLAFDLEWIIFYLGEDICRASRWEDTMIQAYVLDERSEGQSLDFLSLLYFGTRIKSVFNVDRSNLIAESLKNLLLYNVLDIQATYRVWKKQSVRIKTAGLEGIYGLQVKRIPTLVIAQFRGLPVDQKVVAGMAEEYLSQREGILRDIKKLPNIRRYERRFGDFNPSSPQQVTKLFQTVMGKKEGVRGNKYSTDETVLKAIGGEEAEALLSLRKAEKALGTYIRPLMLGEEKSVVYPDGKIHTSFNTTFTRTGRLSSDGPNMQNYPKRDPERKKIRRAIAAPPGHMLAAFDYGQIEARVLAWASGDPVLTESLWEGYDIHMAWAERIARDYPKVVRSRHGSLNDKALGKFRSEVKNEMVFPLFYGSRMESAARNLDIPIRIFEPIFRDFHGQFKVIFDWQMKLLRFYERNGYVECLTGRRRHGPMSSNEAINSPIQGTASDVVVDAGDRLAEHSFETDQPWLHPLINIHDDWTFIIPEEVLPESVETIIHFMLDVPFSWVTTPIQVEAAIGRNWYEMEDIGKFESHKFLKKAG
jgi:uracil-DNA glycosylase family 4